jgi:hypothetical protein
MAAAVLGLALPACSVAKLIRAQAARDFSCPENQVRAVETENYVFKASGCGRDAIYNRAIKSPIERASFDLSCPAVQLKMIDLGDQSIGVEGCGKKVAYAWVDWAWVGSPAR